MSETRNKIINSIKKVERWVESHDYKGYEPFDGLSSFLRPLTLNIILVERILQQAVRQSPANIRPLLGIKPKDSTKGMGYMAWGYLKMINIENNERYKDRAFKCLDWLIDNRSPGYSNYCWGNHFPYSGRGVRLSEQEPTIVWTSLIGQVFIDAYEVFKDNKYLRVANDIGDWILGLPKEQSSSGACLSYISSRCESVHNSNMLGAAMLARVAKFTGNSLAKKTAKEAMEYSCARQLECGAWYYGEDRKYRWIDNFHTGYNLDSLKCYIENAGDNSYEDNLKKGYAYYKNSFIEETGRPKYYHNRAYPIDIQCASQAIDTLANFADYEKDSLGLSIKVAKWTIDNMQDSVGYFYYRRLPYLKVRTPMLHWGQATMYKALAHLLSRMPK